MSVNQSTPEARVVTIEEASRILRISLGAAYQAAKRKDLPTLRVGKRILVPLVALERMLNVNA